MQADNLEDVIRLLICNALDDSPALLPQDRRYADDGAQRLARDQVAAQIARKLAGHGFLPFDIEASAGTQNYDAVSYTMAMMRTRLLKHIRGGGRDSEAEREAHSSIARAFFGDLEEQGWRLVRIRLPADGHSIGKGFMR